MHGNFNFGMPRNYLSSFGQIENFSKFPQYFEIFSSFQVLDNKRNSGYCKEGVKKSGLACELITPVVGQLG